MSEQPKQVKFESTGRIDASDNPDGSKSVTSKHPVAMHIETIQSVGIENLVDIEQHTINTVFNSVSHYLKFIGGGEVRFSYNAKGELLEFTATGVDAEVRNGDRIYLKRKPEKPKPG